MKDTTALSRETEAIPKVLPPRKPSKLASVLIILGTILITVLVFVFREEMQQLQNFGYLGIFLISIAANATIILPVPGLAITTTMGAVFNPIGVAIAAGLGAAIGELTGYAVGRSGSGFISDRNLYLRLLDWMRNHPKWSFTVIIVMAFVPNPLMDVTGMVSGALAIPAWKYLAACAIGKTLKMLVFAYAGHYSWQLLSPQP
ncbi:MAG: VTT domain-containing protein [Anaerolineaceae bacterium]